MNNRVVIAIVTMSLIGVSSFSAIKRALTSIDTIDVSLDPIFSDAGSALVLEKCKKNVTNPSGLCLFLEELRTEVPLIKSVCASHALLSKTHISIKAYEPLAITMDNKVILTNGTSIDCGWISPCYCHNLVSIDYRDQVFPLSKSLVAWMISFCAHRMSQEYKARIVNDNTIVLRSMGKPEFFIVTNDKMMVGEKIKNHCMQILEKVNQELPKNIHKQLAADIRFDHQIVVYAVNEKGER